MITRTIQCAICGAQSKEDHEGAGFPNWGSLQGIALDGEANPHFCPVCLSKVAAFADGLKEHK